MQRKRSRLALFAILSLAVSVTVGLSIGGAAQAKKKGGSKGGGTKTISKGSAAIPDSLNTGPDTDADGFPDCSGNGGCFRNGILGSKIVVGEKLRTAKIKDLNVRVDITHADIGDLSIYLVGPNGQVVTLSLGNDNNPVGTTTPPYFSKGKLGPTTFDDQAALYINDTASTTDPGALPTDGTEAFAPYAGNYKPEESTLASLGSRLFGTWTLVVFDNDAPNDGVGDVPDTGRLNSWALVAQLKGGGGGKKKKKK